MVSAALRDGTADRRCVFEVFSRRLPAGRRYGVVAGTGRLVELIREFRFDEAEVDFLRRTGVVDEQAAAWLRDYRFTGDIEGYAEGELFFPNSPILTVSGGFAECVVLETLVLSVLNHDSAVAAAAARMVTAPAAVRSSRWVPGARTRAPRWPPPAPRTSPGSASPRTWRRAGATASPRPARRRTRSPCCTTTSGRRSPRRSTRWARTPRCSSTPTTSARASATRSRWQAPTCGRSGSTPATSR